MKIRTKTVESSSAMAKYIALRCHHAQRQSFIFVIVQEPKWMAIMMESHAKSNGA